MTKRKSSFDATRRMLKLLEYLSEKPHSMQELLDRLEKELEHRSDRVTIQLDLSRLKEWGFALEVEKRKRVLKRPVFPINFSEETLEALRITLNLLKETGLSDAETALKEISHILPSQQQQQLKRNSDFHLVPTVLVNLKEYAVNVKQLKQAIHSQQVVEFYYKGSRGDEKHQRVDPLSLDWLDGRLYLRAYKPRNNEEFYFRIDRITANVKILPYKFTMRDPQLFPIQFRVWGTIGKNYQKRFYQEDDPIPDPCDRHPDALLIKAQMTSLFWAEQRLLRYLPFVEVLTPKKLVDKFRKIAEEMRRIYLE